MADSAQQLSGYKSQLQQVEAALTVDPDNEDLNKLKGDLLEVIELTQDLLSVQTLTEQDESSLDGSDQLGGADAAPSSSAAPTHSWSVGDRCLVHYREDNQQHLATLDEVRTDGTCTVTYDGWGNTEVNQLSALTRPMETNYPVSNGQETRPNKNMTKKDILLAQREYKRKKSQKKAQRQKVLEEERETEKNKWLSFNSKTFSKTNKGKVKRSIFATPEAINGRVGVGTCGIGGKPMTDYTQQEKWTKK